MKRLHKGAWAIGLLTALMPAAVAAQTSEIIVAQAPDRGRAPSASPAPSVRSAPPAARSAPPSAAPRAAPAPRAVTRPPAAVQRSRPERPSAAERGPRPRAVERALRPPRAVEGNRARERAVERSRARERAQQQVQQRRQQLKERRAQPSPQQPTPKQVDKGPRRPDIAGKQQKGAQPVARVQASDQQRREVRQRIFRERRVDRIPRNRLNVALAVGSRIPRHHRLHRFTPALLAAIPIYAAYRYIVVEDTICVVDPDTYAIVDVIPATIEQAGPPPGSRPALALSAEQMRCVYVSVPKDRARANIRIRLALGAEIPRRVRLFALPEAARACSPALATYRYIVVEDDVVIVDPADYAIALVISA
jgi:hypothetical protein